MDPSPIAHMFEPLEKLSQIVTARAKLAFEHSCGGPITWSCLPVQWRATQRLRTPRSYGTYDCAELGAVAAAALRCRRPSRTVGGANPATPTTPTHVFGPALPDGSPACHGRICRWSPLLPAEFTWRHARALAAQQGRDDTNETEVARVLDDLLTRAQAGPVSKLSDRIAARTRVAAAAHRPPSRDDATPPEPGKPADGDDDGPPATVIVSVRDLRCGRRGGAVVNKPGITAVEAIADEPLTTKESWRRVRTGNRTRRRGPGAARLAKLSECDRPAHH